MIFILLHPCVPFLPRPDLRDNNAFSMLGNPLTPSKVFTALTLFNQLRFPLYFFPVTLSSLADSKVRYGMRRSRCIKEYTRL